MNVFCTLRHAFILLSLSIILVWITAGCSKDLPSLAPKPGIHFITDSGYVFHDTTLLIGQTIRIGIEANANGSYPLTQLSIIALADNQVMAIDSGIYTNRLSYSGFVTKGISATESWRFYVRDRGGNQSDTISLTLHTDEASVFGPITTVPSLEMTAQNHLDARSFYSLAQNSTYSLESAYINQEFIDLLYYYDAIETDANTIASPGANIDASVFPGEFGPANWTTRHTVRFIQRPLLTPADFNACQNDSLILANTFVFSSGYRKAKNLAVDQVYAFVTEAGLKGIFQVTQLEGQDEGSITVSIKMQGE
ncbi:MAG: hypothetical protein KKD74_08995 [Bacteroidetes bacterium]|nr:hypothetical protein [Bacteroidota bacterium]